MNAKNNKIIQGFLQRNLSVFEDCFEFEIVDSSIDNFVVSTSDGKVFVKANNYVMLFHGVYCYLKKYCNVQLSWCGNREIKINQLVMFEGEYKKSVEQKFRVYMNYCTICYSMCWWDFARWEKEIDFMAMNGINMPLAVVGTEAVLYETLLQFGFSKEEAVSQISGPAFWAWHLMTNIMGYIPPKSEKYVYERLALGKQIMARYVEFGMHPIQQGFSGHVPSLIGSKVEGVNFYTQRGWCSFEPTTQIDPLDPFFKVYGMAYLNKMRELFGFYGYVACDPFHEGTPPKLGKEYLNNVGKTISNLYTEFDSNAVWVMQAWSLRKDIVQAVSKDKLLILDINSEKTIPNQNMWGYSVVSGMLHNFGGKNAMQGKLRLHSKNCYSKLKSAGANVVGSGLFMEGIDQNPIVYDLQFELLTQSGSIDFDKWLDDYIKRRYGKYDSKIRQAFDLLLQTCYKDTGYHENAVGSVVASRPQIKPVMTGPCCYTKLFYDTKLFERAVKLFAEVKDEFKASDGYQYDLCDLTRQMLSNRFNVDQKQFAKAYFWRRRQKVAKIADSQLQLLSDLDELLSYREELNLDKWLYDAHSLATDEEERKYFDFNARVLVTLWGDVKSKNPSLYDYSWREWSGLIKDYYYKRWDMLYSCVLECMEQHKRFVVRNIKSWAGRIFSRNYDFGSMLSEFEFKWLTKYKKVTKPESKDVTDIASKLINEYISK